MNPPSSRLAAIADSRPSVTPVTTPANPTNMIAVATGRRATVTTTVRGAEAGSSLQLIGAAIGTPTASKGRATNSRNTCTTSKTVRPGFRARSCQLRNRARLSSATEANGRVPIFVIPGQREAVNPEPMTPTEQN